MTSLVVLCLAVRAADVLLEPAVPAIITAALVLGIAWIILGRPRGL